MQVECQECENLFPVEECVRRTDGWGEPTDDYYYLCQKCNEEMEQREKRSVTL